MHAHGAFELSLRQNVDAYAVNIDGFGHRFEPVIDFDAEDLDERISDILALERNSARDRGELPEGAPLTPTAQEVGDTGQRWQREARRERSQLESFFEFCCFEHSFVELRRRTRQDLEITGNSYWEILRDAKGDLARFVHVPSHAVRLLALDPHPVEVEEQVRISPVSYEGARTQRRLRRYVQLQGAVCVFFKSFGDPRVISKKTGQVYPDMAALLRDRPDDAPATELLHFAIHSSRSPYGVPRWIGTMLSVLGSRQMEEVNYLYFTNKSVPPLALLVSGGTLSESSVPRIERFIEENLKGKENFHKILIVEADGSSSADQGKTRIELKSLTDAQQQDALFQTYDQRNMDKVGGSFRLPQLLRGESRDYNRSVADAQLRFADDQVFQPERDEFDYGMNRKILSAMGVRFWRFRSQTPVARDPERMTEMVEKLVRIGVLVPEEGRMLAGEIFNREFRKISDEWTRRPLTLTLAGVQTQMTTEDGTSREELLRDAGALIKFKDDLEAEEGKLASRRMDLARDNLHGREGGEPCE